MRNNEKYKAIYLMTPINALMKSETVLILALVTAIMSTLALVNLDSADAQNASMYGNMTTATNTTNATTAGNVTGGNMTASDTSSNPAKFHLEEGIKALKSGDTQAAMTHLDAAKQVMVPGEAMNHFELGKKALENGDINGAIMHLTAADQALA